MVNWMPLAKVEVAVPVTLRAATFSPPANVEVAVEEVALKYGAERRLAYSPPAKEEVAVEVLTIEAMVRGEEVAMK